MSTVDIEVSFKGEQNLWNGNTPSLDAWKASKKIYKGESCSDVESSMREILSGKGAWRDELMSLGLDVTRFEIASLRLDTKSDAADFDDDEDANYSSMSCAHDITFRISAKNEPGEDALAWLCVTTANLIYPDGGWEEDPQDVEFESKRIDESFFRGAALIESEDAKKARLEAEALRKDEETHRMGRYLDGLGLSAPELDLVERVRTYVGRTGAAESRVTAICTGEGLEGLEVTVVEERLVTAAREVREEGGSMERMSAVVRAAMIAASGKTPEEPAPRGPRKKL